MLRGVNFSCSLIVLALLTSSFTIFNATKSLPPRNDLPAWASDTPLWPQILLLVIASISLIFCVGVFYGYFRGGHKRAEKVAVYYTVFSVFFFAFSIIMWAVGAAVLQNSKNNSGNQDMWGWACVDNERRELFQNDVSYSLVCRMQVSIFILETAPELKTNNPSGLVPRLLHHRNRRRDPRNCHLRRGLLPLLVQAQAPQVNGRPRQSPLRPLPRPTPLSIRPEHSRFHPRIRSNPHVSRLPLPSLPPRRLLQG